MRSRLTESGPTAGPRPGAPERHEYELYLAVENIDHTRTKTRHPLTNGILRALPQDPLNEFYRVAFRKKIYRTLEELQADLDAWDGGLQPAAPASRPLVLWQDTDPHIRGQCAAGEGENTSGLIPVRTHCLSDEVLIYTRHTQHLTITPIVLKWGKSL